MLIPHDKISSTLKGAQVPTIFFRTYIGAALKACQQGYISSEAVVRVIRVALEDNLILDNSRVGSIIPSIYSRGGGGKSDKEISRLRDLEHDISLAEMHLGLNGSAPFRF